MSSILVTDLVNRVLLKLNEAAAVTDVGSLHTGDGSSVVGSATVTAGGSAYTTATVITFAAAPAGGRTATGTPVITGGVLTGIIVIDGGQGYLSAPGITISDTGGGSGASATAVLQADVLTNPQGIVRALNNSKDLRCHQVYALLGTFTRSWLAAQYWQPIDGSGSAAAFAPQTSGNGTNPATPAGSVLWWPRVVTWTGTNSGGLPTVTLTYVDETALRLYDAAYETTPTTDANTAPTLWYRRGNLEGIGLYPVPAGVGNVVAEGYIVPPDMTTTGTVGWCDPSRAQLLVVDAACETIEKNLTDAQIGARLQEIKEEQAELLRTYWLALPAALRQPGGPFGLPPLGVQTGNGK